VNIGETTATAKTLISEIMVVSPSEFEEQCKQPVAIMNAVTMLVMMAVHFISMYALFFNNCCRHKEDIKYIVMSYINIALKL